MVRLPIKSKVAIDDHGGDSVGYQGLLGEGRR